VSTARPSKSWRVCCSNTKTGGDKVFTNDRDTRDEIHCGAGQDEATIDVVRDETTGDITAADKVFNCEKVFEVVNGEPKDITEEVEEFQNPTAAATSAAADTSKNEDTSKKEGTSKK
jgi:hypothetical protein